MRMTVFGASGGVGRLLVTQALEAGHDVVAVVRDESRLTIDPHPRLAAQVVGDVADPTAIAPAVDGADAVVSALGPRSQPSEPSTICTEGARAIVAAMEVTGVRRLVAISAATVTYRGDDPLTRLVVKPLVRRWLRYPMRDSAGMEEVIAASGLDWTVLRPPMLTDGPRTGRYRVRAGANVLGGFRISRADVADAILRTLGTAEHVRTAVGVAG